MLSVSTTKSVNTSSCTTSSTLDFSEHLLYDCSCFSSFLSSSLAVYGVWNKSSTKLTNALLSYTSSVKLWSPLRSTYTTWLFLWQADELQELSKASLLRWLFPVSLAPRSLPLLSSACNSFTVYLSFFFICPFCLFTRTNCPTMG